ncbi:Endonuclease MutS2 [Pseudovibrio sp. W64]|uniref:Smr/MutS family protein n=1 Tax=unclassified Pseudovibrio TaxID=2627060 RepID=UPI0007AE4D43|nr:MULTISPECIES: Smr/MutS family protein [unclassified Pseudovibrio]KZK84433.1 Endonuclease MutS2 [Pseudovibrio sp. W64]KZK87115.1 Endonuclease MutS2 [Pseudovibrio sp. Ad13]KZL03377.1 Endonuclease MutS2 [Pseudovibrio sp. W74]KZL12169.1 Endonuclease MutS2 [Pseudovibrio sp. Ad14]
MTNGDRAKRAKTKQLSEADKRLWDRVKATLTPIHQERLSDMLEDTTQLSEPDQSLMHAQSAEVSQPELKPQLTSPPKPQAKKSRGSKGKTAPDYSPPKPVVPAMPPLSPLNKKERKKVVRGGKGYIDARIDLHGLTQYQAHQRLTSFIYQAQAMGYSLVLVITGKGLDYSSSPYGDDRGVLRRMVPQWLSLPDMRSCVVGFDQAHVSHGGSGAIYVRIRKRKK